MYWYYMENGQQRGPLNEEEFEESIRSGKIQPETLIWKEGMSGWKPILRSALILLWCLL